jgi:VanZ family protein
MASDRLKSAARCALALAAVICAWGATLAPQGIEQALVPWDKAAHFIAFYGLTLAMFAAFPERRRFDLALVAILAGCAIEVVQQFTGRDAGLGDVAADAAGAMAVLTPVWLERLRAPPPRERRRTRRPVRTASTAARPT